MKKLSPKKIVLHRETLGVLEPAPLREVVAGYAPPPTFSCPALKSGSSVCTFAC